MAAGERGEAVALAMSVLATLGERYDAPDMVPIKGAHVDGCIYRGDEEASSVTRSARWCPMGVPVLEGMPRAATGDQLKALCAALATSGNVALIHVVGVTPEAPTREQAFGGRQPARVLELCARDLEQALATLSTSSPGPVDLVNIGCPHASFTEVERIVDLLGGRPVAESVQFWLKTNRAVRERLAQTPLLAALETAGVTLLTDACIMAGHYYRYWPLRRVVTNSAKYAHYAPTGMRVETLFRSTAECVEAAVCGSVDG